MPTLSELFAGYETEAFRLELLPEYKVSEEWENFLNYKETGFARQNDGLVKYISAAKDKILEGKRHVRARVIPEPITDYFIFETKIGYIPQSKHGFDFKFLEVSEYVDLLNQLNLGLNSVTDFWLFDCSTVAIMEYDSTGKYLGHVIHTSEEIVRPYITIRDKIMETGHSIEYLTARRGITA